MKTLSKAQRTELQTLSTKLQEAFYNLEDTVDKYNGEMESQWELVESALESYNDVVSEVSGFKDDVAGQIQEYIDERSEKWPETDNGQAITSWHDEVENFETEPLELESPESLSVDQNCDLSDFPEDAGL